MKQGSGEKNQLPNSSFSSCEPVRAGEEGEQVQTEKWMEKIRERGGVSCNPALVRLKAPEFKAIRGYRETDRHRGKIIDLMVFMCCAPPPVQPKSGTSPVMMVLQLDPVLSLFSVRISL